MFPYIGGKSHHVKWIDSILPDTIEDYIEVFGGAGWCAIKSGKVFESSGQVVYNDYNYYLANAFSCFSEDPAKLHKLMSQVPKSDVEIYRRYQAELFASVEPPTAGALCDYELAVKYMYLQTQVFAGTPLSDKNVSYFADKNGKYPSKYDTLKKKLVNEKILARLARLDVIENMDFAELIRKYDGPNSVFYVDPPYHSMEFYYSAAFPRERHEELADILGGISGRFALSYYDFPDLHTFYPPDKFNWHSKEVYRSNSTRSGSSDYSKHSRGTEILITNYDQKNNLEGFFV